MGGGFLFCDVRRYSGPEGGVETVFVVVLVVVLYVACFGLFLFELDQFVLLFHYFCLWTGHLVYGGPSFWIDCGVCYGSSWVEGCFLICVKSLVGRSLWFEIGSYFFDACSFRLFWWLLRPSVVEWWPRLIVCSNLCLSAAFLIFVGDVVFCYVCWFFAGCFGSFYFFIGALLGI